MDVDLTGLTGLGTGAIILVLIFRTLWRTDDSWKALLDAERRRAADMTADAEVARAEAAAARSDAAAARVAAEAARTATLRCEEEHQRTAAEFSRLVSHLRNLGLPIPSSVDDPQ